MVEFVSHIIHSKSHDSYYSYIYIYIAKGRFAISTLQNLLYLLLMKSSSLAINRITVVKEDCMLTFVCAVSSVTSDSLQPNGL